MFILFCMMICRLTSTRQAKLKEWFSLLFFLVSAGKPTALAVSKAGFPPTSDIVTAVADVCLRFREAFFSEGVYLHPQQSLLCAMEAVERR